MKTIEEGRDEEMIALGHASVVTKGEPQKTDEPDGPMTYVWPVTGLTDA